MNTEFQAKTLLQDILYKLQCSDDECETESVGVNSDGLGYCEDHLIND